MSTVICITGMHRSGTSLTASWLEQCGLPIHAGRLVTAAEGNPRGHFEDLDMERLQAGSLERRRLGSMGWGVRGDRFLTFDAGETERAAALVAERDARFPTWAWKDPRSLLFLDEWRDLVPGLKVLVVWRPAAEVVSSLLRRSRQSSNPDMRARMLQSFGLWRAYNRLAIEYRVRHPNTTLLVPISQLASADQAVLSLIEERFGLGLRPTPLSVVYDERLLGQGASSRQVAALLPFAWMRGCLAVEAQLRALSDAPLAARDP